jgi:hypothetical protein
MSLSKGTSVEWNTAQGKIRGGTPVPAEKK